MLRKEQGAKSTYQQNVFLLCKQIQESLDQNKTLQKKFEKMSVQLTSMDQKMVIIQTSIYLQLPNDILRHSPPSDRWVQVSVPADADTTEHDD